MITFKLHICLITHSSLIIVSYALIVVLLLQYIHEPILFYIQMWNYLSHGSICVHIYVILSVMILFYQDLYVISFQLWFHFNWSPVTVMVSLGSTYIWDYCFSYSILFQMRFHLEQYPIFAIDSFWTIYIRTISVIVSLCSTYIYVILVWSKCIIYFCHDSCLCHWFHFNQYMRFADGPPFCLCKYMEWVPSRLH